MTGTRTRVLAPGRAAATRVTRAQPLVDARKKASVGTRGPRGSIYLFTACLFLAVAVAGFGPTSAAIVAGRRATPPPIIHAHAALMIAWLLLLIAQSSLMATGRARLHRALGIVSFALAPAMYVMMIAAWIVTYRHAPDAERTRAANMTIEAINIATMFAVFYTWAMLTRRAAPETHKRMIIMATVVLLSAAVGRMRWLPWNNAPVDRFNYAIFAYVVALLAPLLLRDIVRQGRVHRAYAMGIPLMISWNVAASLLWDSPWWQRLAPVLFRVQQH